MLLRRAGLEALGVKTCAGTRVSAGLTSLTTTHRVVNRVHDDTTVVGAASEPAAASCLTAGFQSVVGVADNADGGAAGEKDLAGLARRQFDNRVVTLAAGQLSEGTGRASHRGALAGLEFNTMDKGTDGYLSQGEGIAYFRSNILAADHSLTDLKAVGSDDIGFGAVNIVEKRDTGGAVGIILDALDNSLDTVVVSLEIDKTQFSLVAAAAIAGAQLAGAVTSASGALADGKRLFWCGSSDCSFEHTNNFVSLARGGGLEFSYCHFLSNIAVVVNSLSLGDGYVCLLEGRTLTADDA